MKLTDYALDELIDFVKGDNGLTKKRSGPELVKLFNKYGQRDRYDFNDGGLPRLKGKDQNPSRKEYTYDRLTKINDSINLKNLLEEILNDPEVPDKESAVNSINSIISPDGYKIEIFENECIIIGAEEDEEVEEIEVTFDKIQAEILRELDKAKFTVWVAVSWFSNKPLFDKLVELKERGVNVQVIIVDDDNNRKNAQPIEVFESKRMPKKGYYGNNIMHNKFCIIDSKTVINGSYNWSNSAEYHNENITVIRSRKLAEKFSEQFIKFKNE